MSRHQLTPEAARDVREIFAYIARDKLRAATRVGDAMSSKFRMLARQPLIGEPRDEIAPEMRSFPAGSYVICYVPISSGVRILRVLHGARDIGTIFGEE